MAWDEVGVRAVWRGVPWEGRYPQHGGERAHLEEQTVQHHLAHPRGERETGEVPAELSQRLVFVQRAEVVRDEHGLAHRLWVRWIHCLAQEGGHSAFARCPQRHAVPRVVAPLCRLL